MPACQPQLSPQQTLRRPLFPGAQQAARAARYMPLVRRVAAQVCRRLPRSVELDDMVGAGFVGLMGALERFDPERGTRFESYAALRIRGAILDELRALDWVPRSVRDQLSALNAATRELEQEFGRAPSDAEVAIRMDVAPTHVRALRHKAQASQLVSESDLGPDGARPNTPDGAPNPQEALGRQQLRDQLLAAIGALPDKAGTVLRLYYFDELNLREIGLILGVSESRVCQLRSQAEGTLRDRLQPEAMVH